MIMLLELLHTQPEIWVPYKELSLPARILTVATMNSDELRVLLTQLPISLSPADFDVWGGSRKTTQELFATCIDVVAQLLPLVIPTVDDVDPAEITWALTVVQTRSIMIGEDIARGPSLVPLFDMLNHAPARACDFVPESHQIGRDLRAELAIQVDPAQLRVVTGPDGGALLMRGGRPLGRLDDCLILMAPKAGLRAGEEARFEYQDTESYSQKKRTMFALTYGFYPA